MQNLLNWTANIKRQLFCKEKVSYNITKNLFFDLIFTGYKYYFMKLCQLKPKSIQNLLKIKTKSKKKITKS